MSTIRSLAALSFATGLLISGVASAENVNLKGGSAATSGTVKIKIDDVGSCTFGTTLDVTFDASKRKFTAIDDNAVTFKGKYKQRGTDNRKLAVTFTSSSRKKLEKSVKRLVKDCLGADKVEVDLDNTKITGKVNATFDSFKIKIKADVDGKADGEKGKGKFIFKSNGTLTLSPE